MQVIFSLMLRKITSQIHFSKRKEKMVVPLPWDELLDGLLSMLSLVCGISPNKLCLLALPIF